MDLGEALRKIKERGQGPSTPLILYGANAQLARDLGVPVFIDGDTGQTVALAPDEGIS